MSPSQSTRSAKRTSVQGRRVAPRGVAEFAGKCLLVSPEEALIAGMRRAASSAGWDCASCSNPEESLRQAVLQCFGLAIVDIQQNRHLRDFAELFSLLQGGASGLVITCDRRAEPEVELWARQHGVWLYVPGEVDWDELTLACTEARLLHERSTTRGARGSSV